MLEKGPILKRLAISIALFYSSFVSADVVINEIFPNPTGTDAGYEWVELFNNGELAVNVSSWSIDTATSSWVPRYTLPDSTIINPGAFLVIGDEFVSGADLSLPPAISLGLGNASANGDAVRIVDNSSTPVDTVVYGDNNNDGFLDDTGEVASSLAPMSGTGESIARIVDGLDTDASGDDFSAQTPTRGLPNVTGCNVNSVSDVVEHFTEAYEACEVLVLGPNFIAADGSNVSVSSGLEIDFKPGFLVEQGATLNASVCGQSLCMTSPEPMPPGCHSCVDLICASDASCCGVAFDQACVDKVDTVCGLTCVGPELVYKSFSGAVLVVI